MPRKRPEAPGVHMGKTDGDKPARGQRKGQGFVLFFFFSLTFSLPIFSWLFLVVEMTTSPSHSISPYKIPTKSPSVSRSSFLSPLADRPSCLAHPWLILGGDLGGLPTVNRASLAVTGCGLGVCWALAGHLLGTSDDAHCSVALFVLSGGMPMP